MPVLPAVGVATGAVAFYTLFYGISMLTGLQEFLYRVGVRPLTFEGITGTVTYTLGHTSLSHLAVNMVPLFVLTAFICYLSGWRAWFGTTILIALFSGWFCFFTGSPDTLIVGASGITSGLGVYLFFTAPFYRALFPMVVGGVFTGVTFVSIVSALTVGTQATSWHAHVGGVLSGIIIACVVNLMGKADRERSLPENQAGTFVH